MTTLPAPCLDTGVPALVLKIDHYVLHHGGLGAVRSLGRLGVPVYGTFGDRFTPAAVSRFLSGRFIWRPAADPAQLIDGLARIGRQIGRPAVLVPTDDIGAIFLAEHAAELTRWFLFPRQTPSLARRVASKARLYELCREHAIPCPAMSMPGSEAEARAFLERAAFPIIVKAAEPWLLVPGSGVRSTAIVERPDDALALFRKLAAEAQAVGSATRLIFQEYIPRDAGEDWFFHGYCDSGSQCLAACTGVKLRSYPAFAGPTAIGQLVANPALHRMAATLLASVGYSGIVDLDFRLDRRDGRYKLLDFNPRVGAQFRLCENAAGIDVVRAMHLDLTGRPVPQATQCERKFVVENFELLARRAYRRSGVGLREWLRSLRGVDEYAWFARDDLLPFTLMWLRLVLPRLARVAGRKRFVRPILHPPGFIAGRGRRRAARGLLLAAGIPKRRRSLRHG